MPGIGGGFSMNFIILIDAKNALQGILVVNNAIKKYQNFLPF